MSLYPNPHPSPACYWYDITEKYGAPSVKWCEETLCQFVTEPANTWSNLGYIFAAFVIYYWAKKDKQPELTWLAPAMFLMGAMSFFFHMSNYYHSQLLDFIGMYLFVFWLLVLNLRKAGIISRSKQVIVQTILTLGCTGLVHVMYTNKINFQSIIAAAVLGILITEYIAYKKSPGKRHYKYFYIGLFFVAIAQGFSQLDAQRIWCVTTNHFWQGHALWHVFASIGLTIVYKHWRQEDYSKEIMP